MMTYNRNSPKILAQFLESIQWWTVWRPGRTKLLSYSVQCDHIAIVI